MLRMRNKKTVWVCRSIGITILAYTIFLSQAALTVWAEEKRLKDYIIFDRAKQEIVDSEEFRNNDKITQQLQKTNAKL